MKPASTRRATIPELIVVALIGALCVAGSVSLASGASKHGRKQPRAIFLLGDRAVEGNRDSEPGGRSEAFRLRAVASGTAKSISFYVDRGTRARQVKIAIYNDARGHPGVLLSSGGKSNPARGAWNLIQVRRLSLHRGRTYWLAALGLGGPVAYRDRANGPCPSEGSARGNLAAFPARWTSGRRWPTCPLSAIVSSGIHAPPASHPVKPPPVKPPPLPPPPPRAGSGTNCASSPSRCGYPDPTNTGVPRGTHLTSISQASLPPGASWDGTNLTVHGNGSVISGLDIVGTIQIYANNVTVKNTRVTDTVQDDEPVVVHSPASGTVIQNSTVQGANNNSQAVGNSIHNVSDSPVTVERVYIHNASDGVVGFSITKDSFIITDGHVPTAHVEPIYVPGGDSSNPTTRIDHNTLLNPQDQVSAVFGDNHAFGPLFNVIVNNNIMAGGDFVIELGCAGDGDQNIIVTNNRFSRIYYSGGGQYGGSGVNLAATVWGGNIWDDTLESVAPNPGC